MKIVITGALGHIGSLLIRELPNSFPDLEIIMVDDLSTQRYCSLFNLSPTIKYSFIESKIQDLDLSQLLSEIDVVIHLAAITDAAGTVDKPEIVHQNNFETTKVLGAACLEKKVPLIFPSSTSVYGSQSSLVDEKCKELWPQSPYAECKIKEENYLKQLFEKGLRGIICRLGTIYGVSPGMRFHTAVNKFCWQAVMKQPITVWETAMHQKRPYLALEDCCKAIKWIIQKSLYDGEIYNIVSNNLTVSDVLDEIKKHVSSFSIQLVQHKIMNQLSYEVSADKFSATGFDFKNELSQGIKNTIALLKNSNK
jgi:UDP-glucose 4-epimerase